MGRITLCRARTGHAGPSSRGFPLIERLPVVVTIGPLAPFVPAPYFLPVGKSSARIAKAQITSMEQAFDQSLRAGKLRADSVTLRPQGSSNATRRGL